MTVGQNWLCTGVSGLVTLALAHWLPVEAVAAFMALGAVVGLLLIARSAR
jgi:uncharacterized membrane protein HdeD (DUF308 family)